GGRGPGRAVRRDPRRCVAAPGGRRRRGDRLHALGTGLGRPRGAPRRSGEPGRRDCRARSLHPGEGRCRHSHRSRPARNQDIFGAIRPDRRRDAQEGRPAAPASVEVRGFRGAQGPRRAVGPGGTRLCLEQGGLEIADLGRMAGPHRRFDRPGGGRILSNAVGPGRPELNGLWPFSLSFNIKQSDLDRRTERPGGAPVVRGHPPDRALAGCRPAAGKISRPQRSGAGGSSSMRLLLRFFGLLFAAGTIIFVAAIAAAAGLLWHYSQSLPDYSQLQDYEPAVMTRVHASDGSLLAEYAKERRLYLPIQAVPKLVINAFIAAEDKNFYEHNGLDLSGIVRAITVYVPNYGSCRRPQGGSTITQQVAKNFLLSNELSWTRKIKEALLARKIESTFSKEKILELYLNEIYLGIGAYGVAAASLLYFDKSVHELTV